MLPGLLLHLILVAPHTKGKGPGGHSSVHWRAAGEGLGDLQVRR